MARDIYVDCVRRDPAVAVDALRRHVQVLRPGTSCLVCLSDDPASLEALAYWSERRGLPISVRAHAGYWSLRVYVLPDGFADIPAVTQLERGGPEASVSAA